MIDHIGVSVSDFEQSKAFYSKALCVIDYALLDGPRRAGDGYYESVALDPDGNRIEITV